MSKIITLKDGNTIIYPRTISKQVVGDKKEMGDVQGFIDSLVPVVESPYKYYTVRIDLNNPDPETSCTYMDDAVGMTPGYDGWKDTNLISGIRPCLLNYEYGTVQYQEKDVSTYAVPGPSETYDDYMVEFPLMGYKLWNDDSYQYVSVTDDPNAEDKGYCYYAHSLNTEKDCDKIYIGQFLGTKTIYADGVTRLRSLYKGGMDMDTSLTPLVNTSLIDFRTYASNTGSGYSLISFFPWTLLQCLYVIMYKNLNSQVALGQGYISDAVDVLGTTLSQPFCYGDPNNNTKHVKFLGIEDFWGNLYGWLDGLYLDDDNILTDYRNSQFTGSGHNFQFNTGQIYGRPGYISKILGNNAGGFVPTECNGSNSTYFSDEGNVNSDCFGICGGCGGGWFSGAEAGAFCLTLSSSASSAASNIGARLMYKHLASSGGGAVTPEPQGYKLTLKDFDGSIIAEIENVTNVNDAITTVDTNSLSRSNGYYDITFEGFAEQDGTIIIEQELKEDKTLYACYKNNGKNNSGNKSVVTLFFVDDTGVISPNSNYFKHTEQAFTGGLPIDFYSSTEGAWTSKTTLIEDYVSIDAIGFWMYDNVKTAFEYYYTGNNFTIDSVHLIPYDLDYATFNKVYAFLPQGTNIESIDINGYDIEIIKVRPLATQHSGGGAVDG